MARLAHQMAVESERVMADVVEVSEFPDMARQYSVTGVPKIVINDEIELVGAQPEPNLIRAIAEAGNGTNRTGRTGQTGP